MGKAIESILMHQDIDIIGLCLLRSHLQLPLISSERSWAFAMECKAQLDGPKGGLMRQAMLRRLAKAASHAADFSKFAAARAGAR